MQLSRGIKVGLSFFVVGSSVTLFGLLGYTYNAYGAVTFILTGTAATWAGTVVMLQHIWQN